MHTGGTVFLAFSEVVSPETRHGLMQTQWCVLDTSLARVGVTNHRALTNPPVLLQDALGQQLESDQRLGVGARDGDARRSFKHRAQTFLIKFERSFDRIPLCEAILAQLEYG